MALRPGPFSLPGHNERDHSRTNHEKDRLHDPDDIEDKDRQAAPFCAAELGFGAIRGQAGGQPRLKYCAPTLVTQCLASP